MSPALARTIPTPKARVKAPKLSKLVLLRGPRRCHTCGEVYSRRNRVEAWTVQNQGHRIGWVKTIVNTCTKTCSSAEAANRLVTLARRSST
jgi:hypothetical protein